MRTPTWIFTLFLILLIGNQVWGKDLVPRTVELEWEPLPRAKTYDIEIQEAGRPGAKTFQTKDSHWSGDLVPGSYQMKIRGKDKRGVPGSWSDPEAFQVYLEQVQKLGPEPDAEIASGEEKNKKVKFEWTEVRGAEEYEVTIQSADGKFQQKTRTSDTQISFELDVAKDYQWSIQAINQSFTSDPSKTGFSKFTLNGAPLEKPQIQNPESEFVRNISWQPIPHADNYQYLLERKDLKTGKWLKVDENKASAKSDIDFSSKWPGGEYRLSVTAKGSKRLSSQKVSTEFYVRHGDRSPAAEEIASLRESIDRLSGWYGIASYLITIVDYQSINYDKANAQLSYQAIGGTGRLGAGYLSNKEAWGFLGVADLSGFTVDGTANFTFATAELNAIYRMKAGKRGEIRHQVGLGYKELPETIGPKSTAIRETNTLAVVTGHYGFEYWWAMTSTLGTQVNLHLYPTLSKVKTPNGQDIKPTLSYQFGLLGSYRLKKRVTGLAGWAYRVDRTDYKAQSGSGTATDSDVNSVEIKGQYLNLFLEYQL